MDNEYEFYDPKVASGREVYSNLGSRSSNFGTGPSPYFPGLGGLLNAVFLDLQRTEKKNDVYRKEKEWDLFGKNSAQLRRELESVLSDVISSTNKLRSSGRYEDKQMLDIYLRDLERIKAEMARRGPQVASLGLLGINNPR